MKNMQPTRRDLRIIEQGPLAGMIFSDNPFGLYDGAGGTPPILLPGAPSWRSTPYNGFSILDPAPAGFRQAVLYPDARAIYVSYAGSDGAGRGLTPSTPLRTVAAARALTLHGRPDIIMLDNAHPAGFMYDLYLADDTRNGASANEPMIIGWYGDGKKRPVVRLHGHHLWNHTNQKALKHVRIEGIDFYNSRQDPSHPDFDLGAGSILLFEEKENIVFTDCKFRFVELVVQGTGDASNGVPKDTVVEFCIFSPGPYVSTSSLNQDDRPSTIFQGKTDGLTITDTVFDYGGWHPTAENSAANRFNHHLYLQYGNDGNKLTVARNILSRASSHGAQLRSGGLFEDNFLARNAIGMINGSNQSVVVMDGRRAYTFRNVVTEGWPMMRGDNACFGSGLCSGSVAGIDTHVSNVNADWQVRDNIVHSVYLQGSNHEALGYGLTRVSYGEYGFSPGTNIQKSGNIAWHWVNGTEGDGPAYQDPGRTLADYHEFLVPGQGSYDGFMSEVSDRPPRCRDLRYESIAINAYIREGFII